jgi:hypothetical protein
MLSRSFSKIDSLDHGQQPSMANSIGMDSLSPQIRTILRHSPMATALFGRAKAIRLSQPNRPFLQNYGDRPQKGRLRRAGAHPYRVSLIGRLRGN